MPVRFLSSMAALHDVPVSMNTIAVLPLGATEQHGPHLPLETDTIIAEGVCMAMARQLPAEIDVVILPVEPVGYSTEHMDFAGSKTLSFDAALSRWIKIGEACADAGLGKIVLMNAHGGNSPIAAIVCQELRVRRAMLAVATKWDRFIKGSGIVSDHEEMLGIHGGDIETSVMLALAPDTVDLERAENFASEQAGFMERYTHLRAYGPHGFGWKMQDLNPKGVVGNAAAASAEKGEQLLEIASRGICELLDDVHRFDLSCWSN